MFRFLHIADPHLDSPHVGLEHREEAPTEQLRGSTRRAFQNAIDLALAEQVHCVLIAGDVYDRDWKDYSTGLFFRQQMVRLQAAGIPAFVIQGNHDAASLITRKLTLPDNVHVFSAQQAESRTLETWPVVIHGRSFPERHVPENFVQQYPPAVPGVFNIGLLHTSLNGRIGHDPYAPCELADLQAKGYDYWALGHIHQPEVIAREPWVVFAGNCQGRSVREVGPRGVCLVTVADDWTIADHEWRHIDVVRWAVLVIDVSTAELPQDILNLIRDALREAVAAADSRLLVVRLQLQGSTRWHGDFLKRGEAWEAECQGLIQDLGADRIWLEKLQIATQPRYNIEELIQQDPLVKRVWESLTAWGSTMEHFPAAAQELLKTLPADLQDQVRQEWQGDGGARWRADIQGLILEVLGRQGSS